MHFNSAQERAVLAAVKNYRTLVYQMLKDSKGDFSAESAEYFSHLFQTLSTSQKILEDAVVDQATVDENYADQEEDQRETTVDRPPMAEARVLICDDDEMSIELLGIMLENIGFEAIDVASCGEEALEKILSAEDSYDLIICDWKMPGATGLNVHKEAKAANKIDSTYFILLTAIEDDVLESRSLKQGLHDYIVKPIEDELLDTKLSAVFPR